MVQYITYSKKPLKSSEEGLDINMPCRLERFSLTGALAALPGVYGFWGRGEEECARVCGFRAGLDRFRIEGGFDGLGLRAVPGLVFPVEARRFIHLELLP